MNKNIDHKIVELIKKDQNISNKEISRIIGIPEKEVETRIRGFSDARQKIIEVIYEKRGVYDGVIIMPIWKIHNQAFSPAWPIC